MFSANKCYNANNCGHFKFYQQVFTLCSGELGTKKEILTEGKVSQVHSNLSVESILQKLRQIGGDITQR